MTPSNVSSSPADASESAAEAEQASSEDVAPWVWWLVAALVASAAVIIPLWVVRARRRRRWRENLESAETEVAWLAREFLPQLRETGSLEGVAGGWEVGLPRVTELEDRLTVMESSSKNSDDATTVHTLRDAVRTARTRVESLIRGGAQDMWALDLDETIGHLESALTPSRQPG